jgi:hypothetical protein
MSRRVAAVSSMCTAKKIEAQLKAAVADLMAKAEAADTADIPDGMSIPEELALREERFSGVRTSVLLRLGTLNTPLKCVTN